MRSVFLGADPSVECMEKVKAISFVLVLYLWTMPDKDFLIIVIICGNLFCGVPTTVQ